MTSALSPLGKEEGAVPKASCSPEGSHLCLSDAELSWRPNQWHLRIRCDSMALPDLIVPEDKSLGNLLHYFLLITPHGMWVLGSLNRDQTCAPCSGNTES